MKRLIARAPRLTMLARILGILGPQTRVAGKQRSPIGLGQGESGSALTEMAFVLPVLMIIVTGAASFSMALFSLQQLGNATATSAQQLGADQGLITDPCAVAATTITTALPSWTASKFSYTVTLTESNGTVHKYSTKSDGSFSCTDGATYMDVNQPVTVQATYQYKWMPILNFSPSSPLSVSQTALMQ